MSENPDTDITSLFNKIRDELFTLHIEHKIEYLHYKESVYIPESIKTEYEEAFFHLAYVEVNTFDKIQIFHEF